MSLANQPLDVTINKIGTMLLSTEKFGYLLPFEAISILLLACIIGGIVIARKR
jgi:NADH-quinone oxidoreductase subunit J